MFEKITQVINTKRMQNAIVKFDAAWETNYTSDLDYLNDLFVGQFVIREHWLYGEQLCKIEAVVETPFLADDCQYRAYTVALDGTFTDYAAITIIE